jgi:hypothetical protein
MSINFAELRQNWHLHFVARHGTLKIMAWCNDGQYDLYVSPCAEIGDLHRAFVFMRNNPGKSFFIR